MSAGISNSFLAKLLAFHREKYFEAYDHVVLDYNFAPGSEYQDTWRTFCEKTLPLMATTNLLSKDGIVWLPGWDLTDKACNNSNIKHLYQVEKIMDPREHPLFIATEAVKETLLAACGVDIPFCGKGSSFSLTLSISLSHYFNLSLPQGYYKLTVRKEHRNSGEKSGMALREQLRQWQRGDDDLDLGKVLNNLCAQPRLGSKSHPINLIEGEFENGADGGVFKDWVKSMRPGQLVRGSFYLSCDAKGAVGYQLEAKDLEEDTEELEERN